jgi:hypothetical protein
MSVGRLLTRVERLAGQLTPQGQIIILHRHWCQLEPVLEARAVQALGRPFRPGDLLVIMEQEEACPVGPHAHEDAAIRLYPRHDSRVG